MKVFVVGKKESKGEKPKKRKSGENKTFNIMGRNE